MRAPSLLIHAFGSSRSTFCCTFSHNRR